MRYVLAIIALAAVIGARPAHSAWPESEFGRTYREPTRHHRYHRKPRTVRKVFVIRPERPRDEGRCKPALAIVGDQSPTENGARAQAEKAFQQEVRFRHGEIYADARNAESITFACVDSSVRNLLNRATEAVGVNSQLKRCQMRATPCAAPRLGEGRQ